MYYPVFLNLKGKECVVFGGGEIALRKVEALIPCEARVCVFSPEVHPDLEKLSQEGKIILEKKKYEPDDLVGAHLVICATNDRDVNAAIFREAEDRGLWVNVVDDPQLCNFIAPSILRRGKLVIAVSTEGTSPAMAKKIRQELEDYFGPEYGIFLEAMEKCRKSIQQKLPDDATRKEFFTRLVYSDIVHQIQSDWKQKEVEQMITKEVEKFLSHERR